MLKDNSKEKINDSNDVLSPSETQIYNSMYNINDKLCSNCSVCDTDIRNRPYYICQTCSSSDNIYCCICDECIYHGKNHDIDHTLILCVEHLYLKSEEKIQNCAQFVLTPKILSCFDSLNKEGVSNSLSSKKSSVSSKRSSLSLNEYRSTSHLKKKCLKEKSDICNEDELDISTISSIQMVENEADIDFTMVKKNTENPIFLDPTYVCSKLKNRRKSLKKNDDSFKSALNNYKKMNDNKLFLDGLIKGNYETFIQEIQNEEFKRLEILNLSENCLCKIDLNILNLINIRELNLEKNSIKKIPEEIGQLKNLTQLNVGYNLLVDLPYNMIKLTNLHTLILDYNDFRQIPYVIHEMPFLQILYIEGNSQISSYPPDEIFKKLCNLEIHIDNCPVLMEKLNNNLNIKIHWNCNYPIKILDNLYLGSYRTTLNEYVYQNLNISVVYTIGRDMTPLIIRGMEHKIYILDDLDESNINFDILNSIYECIKNNDICLIHCQMGISRSSTIVIAYLMKFCDMPLREAYNFVSKKKSNIYPNDGFINQLNRLNKCLYPNEDFFTR